MLVGTAHISAASVQEVRDVIARESPAVVAVELDEARFKALTEPDKWKDTKLVDIIKQGKAFLLLAQAFLASYQRRLGEQFGVQPGAEMLAAIEAAKAGNQRLVLADRDIAMTLRRAWARMTLREKLRITWEFMKASTGAEEEGSEPMKPEDLLQEDALSGMMAELSRLAPNVSEVLITERDAYLAGKIRDAAAQAEGGTVVAVIGAGHLKGVEAHLHRPADIPPAESLVGVPKRFPLGKVVGTSVLVLITGAFGYLGYQAFFGHEATCLQNLQDLAIQWFLLKGGLAALGAALALAHPLSILVAFIAAPFSPLHPAVSSGIMSGVAEATVRQPRVQDYEALGHLVRVRDFWRNRFTRVLLVAAFTNIGSMLATAILLPRVIGSFAC